MKLGSSPDMDTKRPRGSERSKPCNESQLTRRSQPPYPWPPEQAQPGVSKPCRTTTVRNGRQKMGVLVHVLPTEKPMSQAVAQVSKTIQSSRWTSATPPARLPVLVGALSILD